MKSCSICDLPMFIPYAFCLCEGRSYYCSQHVDSSGRCPSCNGYFYYYLISIPWIISIRRHMWLGLPIFFWTLLWVVIILKAIIASHQWIQNLTIIEWVICLFGFCTAVFIGFRIATGCIHLQRDSDPWPLMGVLAPVFFLSSIGLPLIMIQLGSIYYYGLLLLKVFIVEGLQAFTVGTCALIITATIVFSIYVCVKSIY